MSQKYEKLKGLLEELFQLDQPDLDFGLYRVMHAKSAEVSQFLDQDLLPQVKQAFSLYKTADKSEIDKELAIAIQQAKDLGAPNVEAMPKVQELRARFATTAVDINALESEVYDHLYSFFRRYYSDGDFLAKRVYKPGVYAVPYEGEETTLYWANKDQYYIKTSEYLRDYAFRLRPGDEKNPMRVHFRLADAAEGEQGNVKAAEGKDRVFILADCGKSGRDFIREEDGEQGKQLSIQFEYRPASLADWPEAVRKGKAKPPSQKDLIMQAAESILQVKDKSTSKWITELSKPHTKADGEDSEYSRLEAHPKRYTARNTFDYFIHKDLGPFLRRELDFYIKNEVMHLDDVDNGTVPRIEQYLSKIKVIRKIAGKIIDFLAQLENFQRDLWLKKKFVVETQYCITLNRIPEEFYAEIAANEAQRKEWVNLLAIDKIKGRKKTLCYSKPLKPSFLKLHPTLVVDTKHFDEAFSARLLEAMGDVDAQTDGILVHGENSNALSLMMARYMKKVKCIYIDPPYNTGSNDFAYKDNYKHSSWLSMMNDRLFLGFNFLSDDSFILTSIDDNESHNLMALQISLFGDDYKLPIITWEKRTKAQNTETAKAMLQSKAEYIQIFRSKLGQQHFNLELKEKKAYPLTDKDGAYRLSEVGQMAAGGGRGRRTMVYQIHGIAPRPGMQWKLGQEQIAQLDAAHRLVIADGKPMVIIRPSHEDDARYSPFWSHFFDKEIYGTAESGSEEVREDLGFGRIIETVKPTKLIRKLIFHTTQLDNSLVLDYFAGSGTTGHAVIDLNREDDGHRRFVLVEMSGYFETLILPRIKKITFSPEWKNGKPARFATTEEAIRSPRIVKVIRLESYEDALNNLETRRTNAQQFLLDTPAAKGEGGFKEQYLLRYMLNVETTNSQSLLNIKAFADPTAYKLKVKRTGSDESREMNVDLLETFNWLIGLVVERIAAPQIFSAAFKRDSEKRLQLKEGLKKDVKGPYWFRSVSGIIPDGRKALIIWRKLTGVPEEDNLVLDEWFTKQGYSAKKSRFDLVYVNAGNNLENLKTPDALWKVRIIEEDFHRLMFNTEGK